MSNQLKDIDKQRDSLEMRLQAIQSRYMKQFVALDALIGTMSSTSSFLTQQLAGLPGSGGV